MGAFASADPIGVAVALGDVGVLVALDVGETVTVGVGVKVFVGMAVGVLVGVGAAGAYAIPNAELEVATRSSELEPSKLLRRIFRGAF